MGLSGLQSSIRRRWHRDADGWSASTLVVGLMVLVPLAAVLLGLWRSGPEWGHISETVLWTYVGNTLVLCISVSVLALVFAIPTAWLVTVFDFPGRKVFEWALVLPLALPTYVAAFAYIKVPEASIPLLVSIRRTFGFEWFQLAEMVLRYGLLSLLLAAVLYPYIYLSVRASFGRQQSGVIEAARVLGRRPLGIFFTVALPLARPAVVAGLSLLLMEVINDYGAVHFFGVPTLTEGIFRTWFGLGDRISAVRLAGLVVLVIFVFLYLESIQRGRARYGEEAAGDRPLVRRRLSPVRGWLACVVCLIPLAIGFLLPVLQLTWWAVVAGADDLLRSIAQLKNSLLLSGVTALMLAVLGLLFSFTWRLHPARWLRTLIRAATLGYAMPGAVVALGIMLSFGGIDRWVQAWTGHLGWPAFFLSGTLFAIGFAYVVRFLAVGFQPIHAGMNRVCGSLDEASRTLGRSPGATLFLVNLPLLRGTLIASMMLIFVDILKELPLTLILRPANFETLATIAFGLASEGRIQESAFPSLMIVAIGTVGLVCLNRFMSKSF